MGVRKSCRRGFPSLSILAAAVVLVAAAPAGALAAETVSETPSGPTEPVTPAPEATPTPSPGWIPQDAGTDTSGDGAAPIRRGSSLGSGGSASPGGSTGDEPSRSVDSGGYYEPESSIPTAPSTIEGATSTPEEASGVSAAQTPAEERPAATPKGGTAAAAPLRQPDVPRGDNVRLASPTPAGSVTNPLDQASSGSGSLPLLAAIVLGLVLVYAGLQLGLRLWRRRDERRQLAGLRHVETEWEATLNRIAPAASNPSKKQPRRVKVGSDSAPLTLPAGGTVGQDRASRKPARAS